MTVSDLAGDAPAEPPASLLGGLDAATYAVDLEIAGERRELVARVFTLPRQRDGAAARRYWRAISGVECVRSLRS